MIDFEAEHFFYFITHPQMVGQIDNCLLLIVLKQAHLSLNNQCLQKTYIFDWSFQTKFCLVSLATLKVSVEIKLQNILFCPPQIPYESNLTLIEKFSSVIFFALNYI